MASSSWQVERDLLELQTIGDHRVQFAVEGGLEAQSFRFDRRSAGSHQFIEQFAQRKALE